LRKRVYQFSSKSCIYWNWYLWRIHNRRKICHY